MKIKSIILLLIWSLILASCQSSIDYKYQQNNTPITSKNIDSPFVWDPNAKAQVTVFADFQCPACIYFEKTIWNKLLSDYAEKNKIWLTYKNFPLPFHKNAIDDANASMCALSEGKYLEFSNAMYALEDAKKWERTTKEDRQVIAKNIGLNLTNFDNCMDEWYFLNKIKDDIALWDKLWLTWTPSVYINWKIVDFRNPDEFFKILDQLIK